VTVDPAFERPYRELLAVALASVRPGPGDAQRRAFGRLAHFLLRSVSPDESMIADVLAAAMASTDHAVVVRCLLCGVWAVAEHDPRLLGWFTKVADRALARGHLAGFCAVLQLIVHLPGFEPLLSATWLEGVKRARESEDGGTLRETFWFGVNYEWTLHAAGASPVPQWLAALREDERVLDAAKVVVGDRSSLMCPLCGRAFSA
jgi:hypothetical protein